MQTGTIKRFILCREIAHRCGGSILVQNEVLYMMEYNSFIQQWLSVGYDRESKEEY